MNQAEIDFTRTHVHAGDPATSHRAAADLHRNRKLNRQQRDVLDVVRCFEGLTSKQMARASVNRLGAWASLSSNAAERRYQISRRLSDLLQAKPPRVRREPIEGCSEMAWFLT